MVDHPLGASDDSANALAGGIVLANQNPTFELVAFTSAAKQRFYEELPEVFGAASYYDRF